MTPERWTRVKELFSAAPSGGSHLVLTLKGSPWRQGGRTYNQFAAR
jgi:hypothetical protein